MEVDKHSFYPLLLDIITDISTAHFVTIDLELSGIPTKKQGTGRQTLGQRYLEVKEAAERYQILQVGITCVQQDVENKKYILQPYNFELSPVIDERGLDVERIFSFQSGAAEFLLKVGFDIGKPFHSGVPYLSRAECREARDKYEKRQDRSNVAEIKLKPTEVESLAFLEHVRIECNKLRGKGSEHNQVSIFPLRSGDKTKQPDELSRYEKRLVHQLVRAEYPELVSISRSEFVQVVRFNKEREDRIAADRKKELEERISRQKGFRWVIEALLGNELADIDLREVAKDAVTGQRVFADTDSLRAQLHRAAGHIRGNPRVLMGHNCFLDLVYIYRQFIGRLPDTVAEYEKKLHALWPTIVDTKYMSTHNCGDINPASSLEQIAHQVNSLQKPKFEVDEQHEKYQGVEAFHEAGYDSFLTAQIAVKLSASLAKQGDYVEVNDDDSDDSKSDITIINATDALDLSKQAPNGAPAQTDGAAESSVEADNDQPTDTNGTEAPVVNGTSIEPEGFTPSEVGGKWKRHGDPTIPPNKPGDPFVYDPTDRKHRYKPLEPVEYLTFPGGMPCFANDFWSTYGNKLRVFGTEEGVCIIDGSGEEPTSEQEDDGGVEVTL